MMLEIQSLRLGPVETNVYLVADEETGECAVIDPAWDGALIASAAESRGWQIRQIWLTHAHFDHLAGISELVNILKPAPSIALHPADLPLWNLQGGAGLFGYHIEMGPQPEIMLEDRVQMQIGNMKIQVRHTPGHTPGHVVFYSQEQNIVFCGDLIFAGGIGRTDLPGGNFRVLMESIRSQILTLPDETVLLSGHGPHTVIGDERLGNPFLTDFF